jgi:hypothetical protein
MNPYLNPYFVKQVTISGIVYTIKVFTDITKPISVTEVVPIMFGIYDSTGASVLTDPTKVLTKNSFISTLLYGGVNSTLAITLTTQAFVYTQGYQQYVNTPLSQNIKDPTIASYQCNTMDNDGVVSVFPIATLISMDDGSAGPTKLNPTTTYEILIDFNILNGISPVDSGNVISIGFITGATPIISGAIRDFSTNCANALFSLNNLDFLDNIENSFTIQNPFNYKFSPVVDDGSGSFTGMTDSNGTDVLLQFDIGLAMQELYVKQYLSEYTAYFNLLDMELETNPNMTQSLLNQTKLALFSKSNLINSFAKGTLIGIETVFGMFCKNLGQYTFRVENSPLNSNFIYRITSDMPQLYWSSVIRDIVHPLSWVDEYIQIDNGASQLPTTSSTTVDPADVMYDSYITNTRNYATKYGLNIDGLRRKPTYYMDIDMDSMYNGDTQFYEMAMVEDMSSNLQFNFKPNEYAVVLNYTDPALLVELSNPTNFIFRNSVSTVFKRIVVDMEFKMNGIAMQYVYKVKDHAGKVIQTLTSNMPVYRGQLPISMIGQDITVSITLLNGTTSITTVSQTVTLPSV